MFCFVLSVPEQLARELLLLVFMWKQLLFLMHTGSCQLPKCRERCESVWESQFRERTMLQIDCIRSFDIATLHLALQIKWQVKKEEYEVQKLPLSASPHSGVCVVFCAKLIALSDISSEHACVPQWQTKTGTKSKCWDNFPKCGTCGLWVWQATTLLCAAVTCCLFRS